MTSITPEIRAWLENMEEVARDRRDEAQAIVDAVTLLRGFYKETREPSPPDMVRVETIKVLEHAGAPLHRKEITARLECADVYPRGKDPVASVSSILSRFDKDFRPYGGGKWGLVSWLHQSNGNGSPTKSDTPAVGVAPAGHGDEDPNLNDLPW